MPRETFDRLLRRRFALPLLLAGVAILTLFNEIAYHRTALAVRTSSALADARIATAGVLQLLTDAETGQRGYLLTGRAEYLAPLEKAKAELPRQTRAVTAFFAKGETGLADPLKISKKIAERGDGVLAADAATSPDTDCWRNLSGLLSLLLQDPLLRTLEAAPALRGNAGADCVATSDD